VFTPFKISLWPNARTVSHTHREDIPINSFNDMIDLFTKEIEPFKKKTDQKIITRKRQRSRAADNMKSMPPYLVTLDYDSVEETPNGVHELLKNKGINHLIFTTWSHKTIKTAQKTNNGKNCFKVVLEAVANDEKDLFELTKGLGLIVNKNIKKTDDISTNIFIKGCHPDYLNHFESYSYSEGESKKQFLLDQCAFAVEEVEEKELSKVGASAEGLYGDDVEEFENYIKTKGQKYDLERIKKALRLIKYEEIGEFAKIDIWKYIGFAFHSTGDNDLFELWDDWALENCSELQKYDRKENEVFWERASADLERGGKKLCTMNTFWEIEKLFLRRKEKEKISHSPWCFFDSLANEKPEEINFLIKDLLVEKSIGFLVGAGGVGKSTICLEIAKAVASGGRFFDDYRYPTIQGTVAIVNKEDSLVKVHNQIHNLVELDIEKVVNGARKDFEEIENLDVIISDRQKEEIKDRWKNVARPKWAQDNIRLTDEKGLNQAIIDGVIKSLTTLKKDLKEAGKPELRLVMFDPLNLWHGGDQNSQKDMSYVFSAFQEIQKRLDVCVIIVHHMNKSNGFSGSHTIRDSGRFMWYLRPKMDGKVMSEKYINFYVEKNNDAKSNYNVFTFSRTEKGLLEIADVSEEEETEGGK